MIEITNLKKTWEDGNTVFEDINLTIEDGEVYAIVGRSGAGKSTLLRCINGLTTYDSGTLKVDGKEVKDIPEKEMREFRRHIGMIFQQFSLMERRTVYENVALPMQCWGYSKEEINKKVMELLELVELADKKDAKPRNLSGGQKQRVAIARALTMEPKVLLCDEATSALDPNTTNAILDLLDEINKKIGITVIIVTHQMEVVRKACSKACILEKGKIAYNGDVQSVFIDKPAALARLLGDEASYLPESGRNIQVSQMQGDGNGSSESLFASLVKEVNGDFNIVDGNIQQFKHGVLGVFTLNVKEEDFDKFTAYFDKIGMDWQEVFRTNILKESEEA